MAGNNLLALDVGEKRIGVARASAQARLAAPYATLKNDKYLFQLLATIIADQQVNRVVIGLPLNSEGKDTAQTGFVRRFVDRLRDQITTINIEFQDETLSSQRAEKELLVRKKLYEASDIDALAATYILQDYLEQHGGAAL
ncbi:Holliday junction resolvase RuvX [Candidatus Saccharibacteria bacterium]|nr:Holliday junction resolvase RuvX [Candidatus Saccharibacteria bacterium]